MSIIRISHLDMIFGRRPERALALLDQGLDRDTIKARTGQVVAVQDISLSIDEGEIFVLMGLSGSGKSTLLRAINGLLPITRGNIHLSLNNPDAQGCFALAEADRHIWRQLRTKHISMVFQKFGLLPWKTVLSNVAFGLELAHIPHGESMSRAEESLKAVGLSQWAHQYPAELSGGMQQRVGLARALATDAGILLMDEPFSALDPLIRATLQQELLNLQRRFNKTILFVSHDLEEALKIGSRIAIMQEGRLIQVGTPEEIITQPKTAFVKEFVAHVEPTRLLRAKALMTALEKLTIGSDSSVALDASGMYRCWLDDTGRPRRSRCGLNEGRMVPWSIFQGGSFTAHDLIVGSEHLLMRDVIHAIGRTHRPMVIQDKAGKMVGAITPDAVLSALAGC